MSRRILFSSRYDVTVEAKEDGTEIFRLHDKEYEGTELEILMESSDGKAVMSAARRMVELWDDVTKLVGRVVYAELEKRRLNGEK